MLAALHMSPDVVLTAAEAGDVAFAYCQAAGLTSKADPSVVELDATLCDALFKGLVKKGEM